MPIFPSKPQREVWTLASEKWTHIKWFLTRYKVIRSGLRKLTLAVDGEWVGGGVKEAEGPQVTVPALLRTDVGSLKPRGAAGVGRRGQIQTMSGLWTFCSWWAVGAEAEGSIKAIIGGGSWGGCWPLQRKEHFSDNDGVSSSTFTDAPLSCFF